MDEKPICQVRVAPDDETLVPGEPEQRSRARRLSEGVPVSAETWRFLLETARSVGLSEQRIGQTRATPAQVPA
jgi:LDH2 family malate/lactate/ureidoglycolate dehydrogenase